MMQQIVVRMHLLQERRLNWLIVRALEATRKHLSTARFGKYLKNWTWNLDYNYIYDREPYNR